MTVRAHVLVSGRVQGVFFRTEMRYHATRYGIKGWVRNLPDSRVEAVFEGKDQSVKRLIEFCKQGPGGAIVTNVEVGWESPSNEFRDFEIRY